MAVILHKLYLLLIALSLKITFNEAINIPQPISMKSSIKNAIIRNSWKPIDWISITEIENIPALDTISWQELEQMSIHEATNLIERIYHISKIRRILEPIAIANIWEIPVIMITPDMTKITFKLSQLIDAIIEQPNFNTEEISIIITGMPSQNSIIKMAINDLINAYIKRYFNQDAIPKGQEKPFMKLQYRGSLIIIDVGAIARNLKDYITMDIEKIGVIIGDVIVQMTEKLNIPYETIHIIGQHMGAHIAGIAGRYYTHTTGQRIRQITGLDPSKIFIHYDQIITGLARGDAEFVDIIHSSSLGFGTVERCGDIDFYPNGPVDIIENADNIIEAATRAIQFYAETVIPGKEFSYPAISVNSIIDFNEAANKRIIGKKAYMGFPINYNIKGDYILKINGNSKRYQPRQISSGKQIITREIQAPWKITYRQ